MELGVGSVKEISRLWNQLGSVCVCVCVCYGRKRKEKEEEEEEDSSCYLSM